MMTYISLPLIYLIFAMFVSLVIVIYAWQNKQTRCNKTFAVSCFITIPWILGDVISKLSNTFELQWCGEILRYLGIIFMPVAMLVFAYQYCGRELSKKSIKRLLVIPAISSAVLVTNPWHDLFFASSKFVEQGSMDLKYGIYFWFVHLPYSYCVVLICLATVLMQFSRASRHYRKQIFILFVSLCIPFIVNVLGLFGLIGRYTPFSFPICFSVMGFAIFRYQFLRSNPIAFETVFQTIRDGVLILDKNDIIRDINPAALRGVTKKSKDIIGFHVRDGFSEWQTAVDLYDKKPLELGEIEVTLSGSTHFLSLESTSMTNADGETEGRIITIRDITDRHKHQLSLEALAFHDPLTRLANRRKFQEEAELAIKNADETNQSFAILYFDLNRFKVVNDTLGHDVGDELLKYVGARVASILRKPDILARLGGDEFALLLHKCDENGVGLVIDRILENVQKPFKVGENTLIADLSIGTAFYPKHGKNLTELLRRADAEMYQAKQNGGLTIIPQEFISVSELSM